MRYFQTNYCTSAIAFLPALLLLRVYCSFSFTLFAYPLYSVHLVLCYSAATWFLLGFSLAARKCEKAPWSSSLAAVSFRYYKNNFIEVFSYFDTFLSLSNLKLKRTIFPLLHCFLIEKRIQSILLMSIQLVTHSKYFYQKLLKASWLKIVFNKSDPKCTLYAQRNRVKWILSNGMTLLELSYHIQ